MSKDVENCLNYYEIELKKLNEDENSSELLDLVVNLRAIKRDFKLTLNQLNIIYQHKDFSDNQKKSEVCNLLSGPYNSSLQDWRKIKDKCKK